MSTLKMCMGAAVADRSCVCSMTDRISGFCYKNHLAFDCPCKKPHTEHVQSLRLTMMIVID